MDFNVRVWKFIDAGFQSHIVPKCEKITIFQVLV